MYGINGTFSASGAGLALLGFNLGAEMLTAIGGVLIGVAVFQLLRPSQRTKP